jgi:hypothetical protein
VDGAIIGPPVKRCGTTRLYLSGRRAGKVAELFLGSRLEACNIGAEVGAASALKMAYAAYTKGMNALLIAIRALAQAEGLDEALVAEWTRSQPDLPDRSTTAAMTSAPKAWRWAGEMEEIAATFGERGLPDGFHLAAAEIFRRLGLFKGQAPASVEEVYVRALAHGEGPQ